MDEKKQGGSITVSRRTLIVLIAAFILLSAGVITVSVNWNKWFTDAPEAVAAVTPDIDPNAGGLPDAESTETGGAATGIKIPGYPSITVAANRTDVTMALVNPAGNPCYFTFEIVLKDTGETIYQSKQVPPGKVISAVKLERALAPGEYDATIRISTNSTEDMHAMNGANVETVLIAK